ncbi:MAG TPA: prolyl oligopeptidase family serine peptidase [Thermoanaerobaculia bacterium]|nr:prolyl oligopeptidase family serine peptidase [Thermoanaerobaculia bacterium]
MHLFRFQRVRLGLIVLGLTALAPAVPAAAAQDAASNGTAYRLPPQILVDLVDAPSTPTLRLNPQREWLLALQRPNLPPISELAERELRLGGLRFRPRNNGPSRANYFVSMELLRVSGEPGPRISGLPDGARLDNVRWSPDGARFAFTNTRPDGIELWVAEVATGQARRLVDGRLNLAGRTSPQWLSDNRTLVVTMVPEGRGPEPSAVEVPAGPLVRENSGGMAPARTFQDLLKSPADETLFEHYLTSQVARVGLDGKVTPLGQPGIAMDVSPSPDGRYLLVQTLHRPFSYLFPADRFPRRIEVWDLDGKTVRAVADIALQEDITNAFDSVPRGPRGVSWRDDAPATLVWAEALDDGDATREAAERDRIVLHAAPFQGEPTPFITLGFRSSGVSWGEGGLALVDEFWWKTRKTRTWLVRPGGAKPELLVDRSFEDRYSDPGFPLTIANAWGRPVVRTADGGRTIFLSGEGASPEGDRPFLDAFDLTTRKSRRLFHSAAPYYERPVDLLDAEGRRLLIARESVDEPTNFYVRDLKSGQLSAITRFPHPTPQLKDVQKELIRYQRADGVQLTATLYTPAGWKPSQGPLPMVFWVYPQEFKTADAAGQVNTSPYFFDYAGNGSPLVWLTLGYAVLDNPSLPIVGEGDKEPNDSYVDQLVASAKAAVDEVVRRGVGDRRRIAIGGHSYGAFTTANLLAHSDLFAAGIAQSGAYNRTLTPFGFQAEERDLWKAPETYIKMSPFMYADKINEPILLIHGQADSNSGTDPIQSERFFNALKGKGAMARLVMLPLESHGYRGRESVLHALWENYNWLDTYVKNRPAEEKKAGAP